MGRSPFDLPDYSITLNCRYALRDDAPPASPGPLPAVAVVRALPAGKVEFADEAHPGREYSLTTREFRHVYDPA